MSDDKPATLDVDSVTQRKLVARAVLRSKRESQESEWSLHPWPFLRDVVHTVDQQKGAEGGAVRRWPGGIVRDQPCTNCPWSCTNYYEHLVRMLWWANQENVPLMLPKSRRLLVSWTTIAYAYWLARYREHQLIAISSRKQGQHENEGSAELVKRAWLIHRNLPPTVAPRKVEYSWCRVRFDNGSEIVGIAQGADQARQQTYTLYVADEFAFWEWAGRTYAALVPTLEGGGQFVAITSAGPGFAEQLVFDRWSGTGGDEG